MAKDTTTQKPFEAGESNARAVRHPAKTHGVGVPQLPQRDAKAAAADGTADPPPPSAGEATTTSTAAATDTETPPKATTPTRTRKVGKHKS